MITLNEHEVEIVLRELNYAARAKAEAFTNAVDIIRGMPDSKSRKRWQKYIKITGDTHKENIEVYNIIKKLQNGNETITGKARAIYGTK